MTLSASVPPTDTPPVSAGPQFRGTFEGARDYTLLTLSGLVVVTTVLLVEDLGWWAVLPLLIGTLSVLTARGGGPAVTLLLVLLILGLRSVLYRLPGWFQSQTSFFLDVTCAGGLLVYAAGHSRLLALRASAVPADPRRALPVRDDRISGRWLLPAKETRRSPGRVGPREMMTLLLTVSVIVLVASLLWFTIGTSDVIDATFSRQARRMLAFAWLAGVVIALVWAMSAYLGRANASLSESALFLQDQFWDAGRGEQRQITRWVVWKRLRRSRRDT